MRKQLKADLALMAVTLGWGISFLLSKNSLDELEPFNFIFVRFFIAFVISFVMFYKRMRSVSKDTLKYGIILGVIMFLMYALQTIGLNYTTVSKSAFITGMNVVMVPIFSALFMKRIPERKVIICTFIAFVGLGLLTVDDSIGSINIGDIYTLASAVVIAFYILYVGKYTVKVDSIAMAVVQFGVVSVLSIAATFMVETPVLPVTSNIWLTMIFLSIACTLAAFVIQNLAQRYTSPSHTALIFTFEPVFAALFGYIFLRELLPAKGLLGAGLIVAGMILMELDWRKILIR
jgi:drug/metabolite transporter (DMT)-like permease